MKVVRRAETPELSAKATMTVAATEKWRSMYRTQDACSFGQKDYNAQLESWRCFAGRSLSAAFLPREDGGEAAGTWEDSVVLGDASTVNDPQNLLKTYTP